MGGQDVHRDTPRGGSLPVLTVLVCIEGGIATTLVIRGSHKDFECEGWTVTRVGNDQFLIRQDPKTKQQRPLHRMTMTDNCMMVNAATAHCALNANAKHTKLDLAFVAQWEGEAELTAYVKHCSDYAAKKGVLYTVEGLFPLLPLKYFQWNKLDLRTDEFFHFCPPNRREWTISSARTHRQHGPSLTWIHCKFRGHSSQNSLQISRPFKPTSCVSHTEFRVRCVKT